MNRYKDLVLFIISFFLFLHIPIVSLWVMSSRSLIVCLFEKKISDLYELHEMSHQEHGYQNWNEPVGLEKPGTGPFISPIQLLDRMCSKTGMNRLTQSVFD